MYRRIFISKDVLDQYTNLFNSTLIQAKDLFYFKRFMLNSNNIKKSWKLINSLLNKRQNNKPTIIIKTDEGESYEGVSMVNFFNKHFVNVVPHVIPDEQSISHVMSGIDRNQSSMFFVPSVPAEVLSIINHLPNKSSGIFDIPAHVIKLVGDSLSCILSALYNECATSQGHSSLQVWE